MCVNRNVLSALADVIYGGLLMLDDDSTIVYDSGDKGSWHILGVIWHICDREI